ncbi:hypothetical protein KEM48_006609 [Puccinia striiformis f. sp. tritici PST-130]|uniref:Uncharacterized protein n=1 Tax=Puccinia striiformis f. sp. tritici PST-78 TaxID=1165861 RepID=A0A0L0UUZ3_9BASI|nr:hypothetical protein KEM48_006609 [Puccinia striiformis f. sp. tritici PST-130]KNE90761.1 hypothetical protein PSTG_15803 [Puccinia striiformis f. sp. tritici PST-78]
MYFIANGGRLLSEPDRFRRRVQINCALYFTRDLPPPNWAQRKAIIATEYLWSLGTEISHQRSLQLVFAYLRRRSSARQTIVGMSKPSAAEFTDAPEESFSNQSSLALVVTTVTARSCVAKIAYIMQ